MGDYFKSYIFEEIHISFPNFTITPITKTEQEIGYVSPLFLQMQCHLYCNSMILVEIIDQVSI